VIEVVNSLAVSFGVDVIGLADIDGSFLDGLGYNMHRRKF
jgi:hypothetical protein